MGENALQRLSRTTWDSRVLPSPRDVGSALELIGELTAALDVAAHLIRDAEKDTNWVSGDPYGESAAVGLERLIAKARGQ